jgi:hypothetical protein
MGVHREYHRLADCILRNGLLVAELFISHTNSVVDVHIRFTYSSDDCTSDGYLPVSESGDGKSNKFFAI